MIGFIRIGNNFIIHESKIESLELFENKICVYFHTNVPVNVPFKSHKEARKEFDRLLNEVDKSHEANMVSPNHPLMNISSVIPL